MCVLCYTAGSGIGEAVLFGGPFAFAAVRRVRARLGIGEVPEAQTPEEAPAAPPAAPARGRHPAPPRLAPAPAP